MNSFSDIEILSEIEAVRQNPWMYIGSVGDDGAHHLLHEIIHNAVDEAMLGHCDQIQVTVGAQSCEVRDNGRGIPTEIHPQAGVSAAEVALTRLHAGSKFRREKARFTAGLHGVGLSCVNALSSSLNVTIDRDGGRYRQDFARGLAEAPLARVATSESTGTTIGFSPDPQIFKHFNGFESARCRHFVENLAHLNPGVEFKFRDASGFEESFRYSDRGLSGLIAKNAAGKKLLLQEPITVGADSDGMIFRAQFIWSADSDPTYVSFVNCVETIHGGTHVNALKAGLVLAVNRMIAGMGDGAWNGTQAEVSEVCEGLLAVLDCKVSHPNFEGQTKSRLTNQEVIAVIERATFEQTSEYFAAHPQVAALVFDRITDSRNARLAAKRVGDRVYLQNVRIGINEEVYKEQFGIRSKNWHKSATWITHEELLRSHANLYDLGEDSVALDVCCGSGVVGASFKGKVKKIIGLDITPEMVKLASTRLDEVVQGNVYDIPFADNSFDLVCTREVLHLLPYPERPVSEIYRVLKPGGQFIVGQILPFSEDDAAWMYRVFKKKQPLIYNMFQEEDFRRLLRSPGFVDMEMTEMNVWESIDVWIDSFETTAIHRHEIRQLFRNAPAEARAVHPFKISANGEIQDLWRWCVFSVRKPL